MYGCFGDKGDYVNIGVIVYMEDGFEFFCVYLISEFVVEYF